MTIKTCQCCGQPLPDFYSGIAGAARLSKKEALLFLTVAARGGSLVLFDTIIDRLWGHDPSGGPIAPLNNICIHVSRINRKMASAGYRVENVWGQGYRLVFIFPQVAA